MSIFSLLATISFVIIFGLYRLKKHIFKLKNLKYHIGSSYKEKQTVYYITYMPKHGVYTHTKRLLNSYSFFVSKEILDLLSANFTKEEDAEIALLDLQKKLNELK